MTDQIKIEYSLLEVKINWDYKNIPTTVDFFLILELQTVPLFVQVERHRLKARL
jgi:hypothetical protein